MITTEYGVADRVAIVTGGGRGIGRAIALALGEAGADITVVARTAKEIEETAEDIRKLGRRALAMPMDVTAYSGAKWATLPEESGPLCQLRIEQMRR